MSRNALLLLTESWSICHVALNTWAILVIVKPSGSLQSKGGVRRPMIA